MERSLLDKLDSEVKHYQDKDFLEAALAVCALAAKADDEVTLLERCQIDAALMREPGLREFDFNTATEILEGYIAALGEEGDSARASLDAKVRTLAGDHKRARTLMRVAYLIFTANKAIEDQEVEEFRRLCGLLDLSPNEVWDSLEVGSL